MEDPRLRKKIWGNHLFLTEIGDTPINLDYMVDSYDAPIFHSDDSMAELASDNMYGLTSLLDSYTEYTTETPTTLTDFSSPTTSHVPLYQSDITSCLYDSSSQEAYSTTASNYLPVENSLSIGPDGYSIETALSSELGGFEYSGSDGDMNYSGDSSGYDSGGDSSGGE